MARKNYGKARTLTPNQLQRVLNKLDGTQNGERNQTILILSHFLGLRAKELATVKIWQVWDGRLRETTKLYPSNTKGGKFREIPLTHPRIIEALNNWVEYRAKHGAINTGAYLFVSQKGTAFSPNSMSRMISKVYQDAGYNGCTSHSGRRSMITRLANDGVDLNSIRVLAGHSSLATTQLYIDHDSDKLAMVMKNL